MKLFLIVIFLLFYSACHKEAAGSPSSYRGYQPPTNPFLAVSFESPALQDWKKNQETYFNNLWKKEGKDKKKQQEDELEGYIIAGYAQGTSDPYNGFLRGTYREEDFQNRRNFSNAPFQDLMEHIVQVPLSEVVKRFHEVFKRVPELPSNVELYRGVNNIYGSVKKGDLLYDPAFLSTSIKKEEGVKYGLYGFHTAAFKQENLPVLNEKNTYCCLLKLNVSAGSEGFFYYPSQVILPPGTYLGVRDVDTEWVVLSHEEGLSPYSSDRLCMRTLTVDVLGNQLSQAFSGLSPAISFAGISENPGHIYEKKVLCK